MAEGGAAARLVDDGPARAASVAVVAVVAVSAVKVMPLRFEGLGSSNWT